MKNTQIESLKDLDEKYNSKHIQLAIRYFKNYIFYSNLLYGGNLINVNYFLLLIIFSIKDTVHSIQVTDLNYISYGKSNLF